MKRFLPPLLFSVLSATLYADLSVQQIEHMVKQIHLKRAGVSLDVLNQTVEPFVKVKKEEKTEKTIVEIPKVKEDDEDVSITLHAIMGDKAYLNDGWKKVGDKVMGYTLKYIGKRGVVLQNGNRIRTLFFGHKDKKNLFTFNERD